MQRRQTECVEERERGVGEREKKGSKIGGERGKEKERKGRKIRGERERERNKEQARGRERKRE